MAPPFAACRICYRIEGKLKNYKEGEFYVKTYEKLTGCAFEDLPWVNKFCPHCATLMNKLFKFIKMCRASYDQLVDYLNTGRKVTQPYLHNMQEWRRYYHPVRLHSWKSQKANVVDCVYSPKRAKAKPKIEDDFYVRHVTVPKNEEAEITQIKPKKEVVHVETHYKWVLKYADLEIKDYMEAAIDNVEEYVGSVKGTKDVPVLEKGPAEILVSRDTEDEAHEENTQNDDNIDDSMDQETPEDATDEQIEIDIKSEIDPDNLTLQEIKEELQAAGVECDDETEDKKKKGEGKVKRKKKEPKVSKKNQRLMLQAKRHKCNQDLEEHFSITTFLSEEEQVQEFLKRRQGEGYLEGRYKCELCLKSFKELKWMDTHVKKHEPAAGTYECSICKIRCRTPKLFRTHRDANHTTRFACKRCPYITYSKAQALKHHGWHEGVEHTCQHCGATFRKHTTYMGHLRRAHPSSYICGVCARSFVSAYGLNLHIKAVHKDINKLESDSTKCEECDVTFVSHKMYIRHILITDKHKEMSRDILGCRKCGEQFASRQLLEQHTHYKERRARRTEAPKRSIKCDECESVFSHPNGVYQHYLREHPDKPYRFAIQRHYLCEQCGKTFKSPGLLQQHALIHKGLRPPPAKKQQGRNSCRICGKTYSKLSGLFRHKLTHQGVRRHKCHICEKAFTDTSNLKQHVQGVHLNIRRVRKR